jgi:hypothetical protein
MSTAYGSDAATLRLRRFHLPPGARPPHSAAVGFAFREGQDDAGDLVVIPSHAASGEFNVDVMDDLITPAPHVQDIPNSPGLPADVTVLGPVEGIGLARLQEPLRHRGVHGTAVPHGGHPSDAILLLRHWDRGRAEPLLV